MLTVQTIFSSVRPEMTEEYFSCRTSLSFIFQYVGVIFNHNSRIPNAEKLAIIEAKILNIWAKCAAPFTYSRKSEVVSIFPTKAK